LKSWKAGKLGGWEAGKLGGWEAGRLGSDEDRELKSLTPYRFPAFCSELLAINW